MYSRFYNPKNYLCLEEASAIKQNINDNRHIFLLSRPKRNENKYSRGIDNFPCGSDGF